MKVLSVINNDKDAVTKEYVDSKAGVTAVDPTSGPVETDFFIPTKTSELTNDSGFITEAALTTKQDTLVSGTNIKTINNQSLLGNGNIDIEGGSGASVWGNITGTLADQTDLYNELSNKVDKSADYGDDTFGMFVNDSLNGIGLSVSDVEGREYGKVNIDTNGVKINGLIAPTNNKDAATKEYVDSVIPTKTSDLTNDSGFITSYTETDPIFNASAAKNITSTDITNWNNKSDFSGSYNDLTDLPVPTDIRINNSSIISGGVANLGVLPDYNSSTNPLATMGAVSQGMNAIMDEVDKKQDTLVSGTNIKTINSQTLLGSGNITIEGTVNELVSPVILNQLSDGYYRLPSGCVVYSMTGDLLYTIEKSALLSITNNVVSGNDITTYWIIEDDTSFEVNSDESIIDTTSDPNVNIKYGVICEDTGDVVHYDKSLSDFITSETDPVFTASAAHGITSTDITNWNSKQDTLVSGTNIKTINNQSILGSGNVDISGSSSSGIQTLVGTQEEPINLNTIDSGIYNISGYYTAGTYTTSLSDSTMFIVTEYSSGSYKYRNVFQDNPSTQPGLNYYYIWDQGNGSYSKGNSQTVRITDTYDRLMLPNLQVVNGASHSIYGYQLLFPKANGTWQGICKTRTTSANKTVTTEGILPGQVLYYDYQSSSACATGSSTYANLLYSSYSAVNVRYNFNVIQLETKKPVYLKGTIGNDGLYYLDTTTWWSQTLPSTEDGYVYMYLGEMKSTTEMILQPFHPMYEYKNGKIRLYQQDNSGGGGGGSVNLSDFLAPVYNSSSTYDSGDIVIYDNDLYMCMDDSVTGTWDSTSWQAIKVSDLFGDLNYISYVTGDLPINMEYVVRWAENELNRKAYADNFASDYDSTSSYAVGDYVMKDGSLYKCNTAISGGETWNSSHWTFTPIATEVKEVYDTLGDIETLLGGI